MRLPINEVMQMQISNDRLKDRQAVSGESGFSMLEVIMAMVIFLGVTASIWGLLQVGVRTRTATTENVHLTKSVRTGLNLIGRDTYNAGLGYPASATVIVPDNRISTLLGIPPDVNTTRDMVPPIISGNNITLNTFNQTPGVSTDQVTFLFKDTDFNMVPTTAPVNDRIPQPIGINLVTVGGGNTDMRSSSGSVAMCAVNDLYLATGAAESRLGVATSMTGGDSVRFTNGDPLNLNLGTAADSVSGIAANAALQKVQMVTYFVTADGTLVRRQYVNRLPAVNWVDEPLVYGVENFQIQYVMNNGTLSDNPSAGPNQIPGDADDDQANLALVRQVRFTITVRSVETTGANNQFFRETMTATFSTRNMGYEAN